MKQPPSSPGGTDRSTSTHANGGSGTGPDARLCCSPSSTVGWLGQPAGLPPSEIVFIRYAGQLLFVSALFLPTRGSALVATRSLRLEVLRGLCLLGSTLANFTAIVFLPLTVTASISFTTPLILCALSIPFLGERVGWRRWLAIVVGFIGVLVIVQPGTSSFHPAAFLSLLGAAFTALYFLLTRKLAGVDSVTTQQFYAAFVATICLIPLVPGGWVWPSDPVSWVAFFAMGGAALVGHQLMTTFTASPRPPSSRPSAMCRSSS